MVNHIHLTTIVDRAIFCDFTLSRCRILFTQHLRCLVVKGSQEKDKFTREKKRSKTQVYKMNDTGGEVDEGRGLFGWLVS